MSSNGCGSGLGADFYSYGGAQVPMLSKRLSLKDRLGDAGSRLGIFRSRYSVSPGVYAVGSPNEDSRVLVTANYKLTVDSLRKELSEIDAWILILDTKGINVWCAAGKGTFGTKELISRISEVGLEKLVRHRTLILPQLGAPGVSAPAILKSSGFRVIYGPVRARDIPAFLSNGLKKDDRMRRVQFRFADRMAVSGIEVVHSWPFFAALLAVAAILSLPFNEGYFGRFLASFLPFAGSVLVGTLVFPALLPLLPTRVFSVKGAILGAGWAVAAALIWGMSFVRAAGTALIVVPVVSFIAMNFTGSSTFTCQTGAELEVKRGLIPMVACLIIGMAVSAVSSFTGI
jgi:hypothetical protein